MIGRAEFLAALGRFGVSPFQYTAEEVSEEAGRWPLDGLIGTL
jgi:hypothetical protein